MVRLRYLNFGQILVALVVYVSMGLVFQAGSGSLSGADLQRVVCIGEDIPGMQGTKIENVNSLALGPSGHAVVALHWFEGDGGTMYALSNPDGGLQKILSFGDTASGAPGTFGGSNHFVVSSSGSLMFVGGFSPEPFVGRSAVLTGSPGNLSTRIFETEIRPEVGPGMSVVSQSIKASMNRSGQIAYFAELYSEVSKTYAKAIWQGTPGSESLVLQSGETYPGLPPDSFLSSIGSMWLNNDGVIAFGGQITQTFTDGNIKITKRFSGLWTYDSGSLTEILLQDQPAIAAGLHDGETWTGAAIRSVADNGWMAISAFHSGGSGLFLVQNTKLTLVLDLLNPIDPDSGAEFDIKFSQFGYTTVFATSSNGRAILATNLEVGDEVTSQNRAGIWVSKGGALTKLIRQSDTFKVEGDSTERTLFGVSAMGISENGRIFFDDGLSGGNVYGETAPGRLAFVATDGKTIDSPEGSDSVITVASIGRRFGNGADGLPTLINSSGQVLISVREKNDPFRNCVAIGNAGEFQVPSLIIGEVRDDNDGDGDLEDDDPPLHDATIELYKVVEGLPQNNPIEVRVTEEDGLFSFEDIPAGDYLLVERNPPGYLSSGDSDPQTEDPDSIRLTLVAAEDSTGHVFLDKKDVAPKLKRAVMRRLGASGVANLGAGKTNIDAPIEPVTDPEILGSQRIISEGVIADGVTPLVFTIEFDPESLPFEREIRIDYDLEDGANDALIRDSTQVLSQGVWKPFSGSVTITADEPIIFLYLNLIVS